MLPLRNDCNSIFVEEFGLTSEQKFLEVNKGKHGFIIKPFKEKDCLNLVETRREQIDLFQRIISTLNSLSENPTMIRSGHHFFCELSDKPLEIVLSSGVLCSCAKIQVICSRLLNRTENLNEIAALLQLHLDKNICLQSNPESGKVKKTLSPMSGLLTPPNLTPPNLSPSKKRSSWNKKFDGLGKHFAKEPDDKIVIPDIDIEQLDEKMVSICYFFWDYYHIRGVKARHLYKTNDFGVITKGVSPVTLLFLQSNFFFKKPCMTKLLQNECQRVFLSIFENLNQSKLGFENAGGDLNRLIPYLRLSTSTTQLTRSPIKNSKFCESSSSSSTSAIDMASLPVCNGTVQPQLELSLIDERKEKEKYLQEVMLFIVNALSFSESPIEKKELLERIAYQSKKDVKKSKKEVIDNEAFTRYCTSFMVHLYETRSIREDYTLSLLTKILLSLSQKIYLSPIQMILNRNQGLALKKKSIRLHLQFIAESVHLTVQVSLVPQEYKSRDNEPYEIVFKNRLSSKIHEIPNWKSKISFQGRPDNQPELKKYVDSLEKLGFV